MPSGVKTPKEIEEAAIEMIADGVKRQEISETLGLSLAKISKLAKIAPHRETEKTYSIPQKTLDDWDDLTRPYWKTLWAMWDKGLQEFRVRVAKQAEQKERRSDDMAGKADEYKLLMQRIGRKTE